MCLLGGLCLFGLAVLGLTLGHLTVSEEVAPCHSFCFSTPLVPKHSAQPLHMTSACLVPQAGKEYASESSPVSPIRLSGQLCVSRLPFLLFLRKRGPWDCHDKSPCSGFPLSWVLVVTRTLSTFFSLFMKLLIFTFLQYIYRKTRPFPHSHYPVPVPSPAFLSLPTVWDW